MAKLISSSYLVPLILPLSSNKKGWPWYLKSEKIISPKKLSGKETILPRITIVTPSYNQADYLEETIRSVLLQGYPNLEYIIMDGGSNDNSKEIIQYYSNFIDYWVSEKDKGQSSAILSGFNRSTGTILGFVNSDDILLPNALNAVGHFFHSHKSVNLLIGKSVLLNSESQIYHKVPGIPPTYRSLLFNGTRGFNQPASFWRKDTFYSVGGFESSLLFSFDYDLYLRLTRCHRAFRVNEYFAGFRMHPQSKTSTMEMVRLRENAQLREREGISQDNNLKNITLKTLYSFRYRLLAGVFKIKNWFGFEKITRI